MRGKKGKLWGIRITSTNCSENLEDLHHRYNFIISKGSFADPMFFTNPSLRKILNEHPRKIDSQVGFINYEEQSYPSNSSSKQVWVSTYPFESLSGHEIYDKLKNKGIASALEGKVLQDFSGRYGRDVILHPYDYSVAKERRKQISDRGIKLREPYSIYQSSVANMIRGINTVRRQNRKKHRK